jgi:hypothetical protein
MLYDIIFYFWNSYILLCMPIPQHLFTIQLIGFLNVCKLVSIGKGAAMHILVSVFCSTDAQVSQGYIFSKNCEVRNYLQLESSDKLGTKVVAPTSIPRISDQDPVYLRMLRFPFPESKYFEIYGPHTVSVTATQFFPHR